MKPFLNLLLLLCLTACNTEKRQNRTAESNSRSAEASAVETEGSAKLGKKIRTKADSLVAEAIAAHGGGLYDEAHFAFKFRKKQYSFQNSPSGFRYTATGEKDGKEIIDVLENGELTRTIDGDTVVLYGKDIAKYTESLNSVVYFATLPHKLGDPAVNKNYKGPTSIKGKEYDVIAITFDQEGGGGDFNDEFRYWINSDTKTVDYLAYNYETNDGGVRFRSAYNPRTVGGIRFQDYVNYEAPIGTPLDELPTLYEEGKLKELSRIETEDVVKL